MNTQAAQQQLISPQNTQQKSSQVGGDIMAFQRRFLRECHRSGASAMEVAVIWRGQLQRVDQHRKPQSITLGSESQSVQLSATAQGGWALTLDAAQEGFLLIDPAPQGRRQHDVSELLDAGLARRDGDRLCVSFSGGTRARLVFGDLVVLLHQVTVHPLRLPRFGGRVRSASGVILGLALSMCLYLIFGGLVAYSSERSAQMAVTLQDLDLSAHSLRFTPPEERKRTPAPDESVSLITPELEPVLAQKKQTSSAAPAKSSSSRSSATTGGQGGPSGPSSASPAQRRVNNTSIGRNQGALLALASFGGPEAASDLNRAFDGQSAQDPRGLNMLSSGCFGPDCQSGPGSTNTGGFPGGVPSGKDGGDPRLTARAELPGERAQAVPQPKLTGGDVTTTGFDKQIIKRVINQKRAEITQCYNKELMKNPSLKGRITMKWRILSSGNVGAVEVVSDEMSNQAISACLKGRIAGWKFPSPKGGVAVDVAYPFNFSTR
jgi:hypothetical protein